MEFCSVIQQTLSSNFWSVISSWFVPDDSVLCSSRQKYLSHHFYSLWSEFLLARPPDYSKHLWRLLAQPADRWPDHLSGHQTNHLCLHNDQTIAGKCGRSEQKERKQAETCTKDVNKITRAPPSRLWEERWAAECDHKLTWERPTHQANNVPFSNKHLLILARPPGAQRWAGAAFTLLYQVSFAILTNLGWFGRSKHGGL